MNRNEYMMYGSPEYQPEVARKSQHVVPTIIWAGTMLYFFCHYCPYTSPEAGISLSAYSCWSYPYSETCLS